MGRAKVKRQSTNVDMTAMCDVAFLLLTFFILVGQFKPSEAIEVSPPSSVSNKVAPLEDFFLVTISKDNQFFISMDEGLKDDVIEKLNELRGGKLSDAVIAAFNSSSFIGVPLNQLPEFAKLSSEQISSMKLPGIPADSTNNQLLSWITAAVLASQGEVVHFNIKADDATKYTAFKKVLDAFQENDIYKYNLVTNAEEIPKGSALYKKNILAQQSNKDEK